MASQDQQRSQVEQQVMARASQDQNFRQELLANPRQTLSQELGVDIPPDVQIQVVEESPNSFVLVLPPAVASPGHELSQGELSNVAGGWSAVTDCVLSCGGCTDNCPIH